MKATIFIPTYNGEKYINDILRSVFRQKVDYEYEVLIIDSGSSDGTLRIIQGYAVKHANLRFVEIPNKEFGHGRTRNKAAELAHGEYVVFLSHDAIPAHRLWLYEMLKPFDLNDKIVGVMGRQAPRPKTVPLQKYEIIGAFRGLGPEFGTTLFYNDVFMKNRVFYDSVTFYSDVNSAARRDFLLNTIQYRDVPYAEDQLFGRDVIGAGYVKAYASRATVIHSNDLTYREYKHRIFDEIVGLRRIGTKITAPSRKAIIRMTVIGAMHDTYRILMDREYSLKRKAFWLVTNPFYHIEKWRGYTLALKVKLSDTEMFGRHSLEMRRKV